jgi:hypothetical protein
MTLNSAGDKMGAQSRREVSPAQPAAAVRVTQPPTFIIGNKAFFIAIKRALDVSGGFHIVGAFRAEDLQQSLRRSVMLGQKPMVCVIHEPAGEQKVADDAAHAVLQTYPQCGIVLVSGGELEAAAERRIGAHDFNAVVVSDSVTRNPKALAASMRSAMSAAENGAAR